MKTKKTNDATLLLLGETGGAVYEEQNPEVYVPSGIKPLDDLILGAIAGEVLLIAGQPSQGKTALAMQWAVTAANNGIAAGILSLEMGRRALRNRIVSGLTGVPMSNLRTHQFENEKQRKLAMDAADYLASIPLYVDDRKGLRSEDVIEAVHNMKDQGIGLVVVDYLQLISGNNESRVVQVGDAIRAVKQGALDTDLPLIVVSSLNRGGVAEGRTPRLSDLRDSGDIEYVADTVIMFHYPEDDQFQPLRACDMHVLKQRNGATGMVPVQFNRPAMAFQTGE